MQKQKFSVTPFAGTEEDLHWMSLALEQADLAEQAGEVPIGAVIVMNGQLLASAHNSPVSRSNPCAHAEILAIERACCATGNYRLGASASLYVTLQPCLMCLGAILHARLGRVVVGCSESRFNSNLEESLAAFQQSNAWHPCSFETDCLAPQCEAVLTGFFKSRRRKREQSVAELRSLMNLPNANKETIAELGFLGLVTAGDVLRRGLDSTSQQLYKHAQSLLEQKRFQQAAIFFSLADYFGGEPVQSWKNYLQG